MAFVTNIRYGLSTQFGFSVFGCHRIVVSVFINLLMMIVIDVMIVKVIVSVVVVVMIITIEIVIMVILVMIVTVVIVVMIVMIMIMLTAIIIRMKIVTMSRCETLGWHQRWMGMAPAETLATALPQLSLASSSSSLSSRLKTLSVVIIRRACNKKIIT